MTHPWAQGDVYDQERKQLSMETAFKIMALVAATNLTTSEVLEMFGTLALSLMDVTLRPGVDRETVIDAYCGMMKAIAERTKHEQHKSTQTSSH